MDIEQLTKAQLVLLALLVSFVTSIATGIVTVSLLDQAPPAVTRTINRVVERTVERVVPDTSRQSAAVTTKEVTVVVKEEDLITASIEKNAKSMVRLYTVAADEAARVFLGLGILVNKEGLIATDASLVVDKASYAIVTSDGKSFTATVILQSNDIALLRVAKDKDDKTTFAPVSFAGTDSLKLGQTVIALGGGERAQIAMGVIAGLIEESATSSETATSSPKAALALIDTTISSKAVIAGSPLINIFGEVIGLNTVTSRKTSSGAFTPTQNLPGLAEEAMKTKENI